MTGTIATALRPVLRAQDVISRTTFRLGAAALGLIVVIYAYEVVVRYFLLSPTLWASDFVSFLLLISVFLVMPWLTREGGHVAVTLVPDHLPPFPARLLTRAGLLIGAVVCLWAFWICLQETASVYERGTMTLTTVRIPKWTLMALIAYGLGNSGLHFLRAALRGPERGAA
jgi:TRAP-type C4-dicarboxylate transport system permease small subunit